jgi:single-strand DNA-binding protein
MMPNLNKVYLLARVTREPTSKETSKGTTVCELGLAVNRASKGPDGNVRNEVLFVDAVLFGKTAQIATQYLAKGRSVFVEGRLKFDQWEKDGQKRSKLTIVGENIQLLGDREQEVQDRPAAPPAKPEITENEFGEPSDIEF